MSTTFERLQQLIPGGVNSPIRACKAVKHTPIVAAKGEGPFVWDDSGKRYIDYCLSWGPLILGHAHPEVIASAYARMQLGTTFGMTTAIEGELAEAIIKAMPSIEMIRFVSTGTEATMTAARLARGFTKRNLIIKFIGHYHGHADFLLVQAGSGLATLGATSSSDGVPDDVVKHTACLPFNDSEAFLDFVRRPEIARDLAAVIVEPIAANMGVVPAERAFLQLLRDETERLGALLIMDEVVTGFRVGFGGAQEYFGIAGDLTCLGKIIGGGFPAAAFGGSKEIMAHLAPLGTVYQAGTLSGNPVAMQAGLTTLNLLRRPGLYDELQTKADTITKPVAARLKEKEENACIRQVGSMFTLFFGKTSVQSMEKQLDLDRFADFFAYMAKNGVYIPPYQYEAWFVSTAHDQELLEKTRDLILDYFA